MRAARYSILESENVRGTMIEILQILYFHGARIRDFRDLAFVFRCYSVNFEDIWNPNSLFQGEDFRLSAGFFRFSLRCAVQKPLRANEQGSGFSAVYFLFTGAPSIKYVIFFPIPWFTITKQVFCILFLQVHMLSMNSQE